MKIKKYTHKLKKAEADIEDTIDTLMQGLGNGDFEDDTFVENIIGKLDVAHTKIQKSRNEIITLNEKQ